MKNSKELIKLRDAILQASNVLSNLPTHIFDCLQTSTELSFVVYEIEEIKKSMNVCSSVLKKEINKD